MNVYIRIELLTRELQGRLLLALVAAERGHGVLLGKFNHGLLTGGRRGTLPPGVFHDKSLGVTDAKRSLHRTLDAMRFVITAQDEEHGLAEDTFTPMAIRFDPDAMSRTARLFAWGPFDGAALRQLLPEYGDRIIETGSPRVDFWRPELRSISRDAAPIDTSSPVILYAASGGEQLFDGIPAPWDVLGRPGLSAQGGLRAARRSADSLIFTAHARLAIESLAREFPEATVVVRPHPAGRPGAWESLLRESPANVVVVTDARVSPWLEKCAAVVTNGSTVAFEAAVSGRPGISYTPEGFDYAPAANRVLRNARTVEELLGLVRRSLQASLHSIDDGSHGLAVQQELDARFAALNGSLAADRIVDAWEEVGEFAPRANDGLLELVDRMQRTSPAVRRRVQHRLAALGGRRPPASRESVLREQEHDFFRAKFPPIDVTEVREIHQALVSALGRFDDVCIRPLHDRLLHITRSS